MHLFTLFYLYLGVFNTKKEIPEHIPVLSISYFLFPVLDFMKQEKDK